MSGDWNNYYEVGRVRDYVARIVESHGVGPSKARTVADVLVEADLRGIWSHGINNLDLLVISAIERAGAYPEAVVEDVTTVSTPAVRHLDAHGDLGACSAMVATDLVKEMATNYGLAKVYVHNANHFGAGAIYTERICADGDLAGRVTCTTPSLTIPHGGRRKRLGTNLICWSVPYDGGFVTIDMATTVHSASGVVKAIVEGSPLPFPVYDPAGEETLDSTVFAGPDDFLARGAMIPLGGLATKLAGERSGAGYKGSGLAILIELDSVIGGGFSTYIDPTVHDEGRWIRQTFEAWRIDTLYSTERAIAEISRTVKDIRNHGGRGMLLPGESELRQRRIALERGIHYAPVQIGRLESLGAAVGLPALQDFDPGAEP
jgi:LDH2 family malate/lactate/ureidoglycolate dehydrogenase